MNKSLNRATSSGTKYSQKQAEELISQWSDIAKGRESKDLRSIQRDLTRKVNNREAIPEEFLGSSEIAYKVAGVVTKELMDRQRAEEALQIEKMRVEMIANHRRLANVYGK